MSNFKEAEMPFPWIPILIVLSSLVLVILVGRWLIQYGTYLWNSNRAHSKRHRSKKKRKHKKAKYSDSESSSESSEDSSE